VGTHRCHSLLVRIGGRLQGQIHHRVHTRIYEEYAMKSA
jgi:hypothetical protein